MVFPPSAEDDGIGSFLFAEFVKRVPLRPGDDPLFPGRISGLPQDLARFVITSDSIHYTKLYDIWITALVGSFAWRQWF